MTRVLIVDDEPDVEMLFRQQFRREEREGLYTLAFALSAVAALEILDGGIGEEIILLVSDINMPGMSGLDLLPIVKTRRPDLSVFMISAYGDADTVGTALAWISQTRTYQGGEPGRHLHFSGTQDLVCW